MYGEVHFNRVVYKRQSPGSKPVYRQVAVVEGSNQFLFLVKIFVGEVVQTDPKFIAECLDAEVYYHSTLHHAVHDAQADVQESISSGEWRLYKFV